MSSESQSGFESCRNLGIVVRQNGFPPRPLKALVVDDDEDFRELLCAFLGGHGVEAVQARHGHEALSIVDFEIPDVVFLDHRMPGLTGAQIARSLRATGHKTTVVLVTGESPIDEIANAAGTPWRLAKPLTTQDLGQLLLAIARQSSAYVVTPEQFDSTR